MFRKYEKIYRINTPETIGLLTGECHIQEKIDGANASIWIDNTVQCGSRNRHLIDDDFNGFVSYVNQHSGIIALLHDRPSFRLYGEWLVKHTIAYNEDSYKQFYLFDIIDNDTWLTIEEVYQYAKEYNINTPHYFGVLTNPTTDQLNKYVGVSTLGKNGEGIVIKNHSFVNQFGNRVYGKMLHEKFQEDFAIKSNNNFGDDNLQIVHKYITPARVAKICQKLQPEINEPLQMKHIPRVCESVYYDMLTEEIYSIAKKWDMISFKQLKHYAFKKAKEYYIDYINK